jgi:hypothetical protein
LARAFDEFPFNSGFAYPGLVATMNPPGSELPKQGRLWLKLGLMPGCQPVQGFDKIVYTKGMSKCITSVPKKRQFRPGIAGLTSETNQSIRLW